MGISVSELMGTEDSFNPEWLENIDSIRRISNASNAVFELAFANNYCYFFKPRLGESPLWDFESGKLWLREYFAYLILKIAGVSVPETHIIEEGPIGSGLLVRKVTSKPEEIVRIAPIEESGQLPWLKAVEGVNQQNEGVQLLHIDDSQLRRIALMDVVINNADRKASHVLKDDEKFYAIDHGLTFHQQVKLRTFLWGWAGMPLTTDELFLLENIKNGFQELEPEKYISELELIALTKRFDILLQTKVFPGLPSDRYALPSPIF